MDHLLLHYLPRLPHEMMLQILSCLPYEYANEAFNEHPSPHVRHAASLCPKLSYTIAVWPGKIPYLISGGMRHSGVPNCLEQFQLARNKGVVPSFHFDVEFAELNHFIEAINDMGVSRLCFKVSGLNDREYDESWSTRMYTLKEDDLKNISALKSIHRMEFKKVRFGNKLSPSSLSELFANSLLRKLEFSDCDVPDWPSISPPPALVELFVSSSEEEASPYDYPPVLNQNTQPGRAFDPLIRFVSNGQTLKILELESGDPQHLLVDDLPSSLEELVIFFPIKSVLGSSWPPLLKTLELLNIGSSQGIQDALLRLPSTIRSLSLNYCPLEWIGADGRAYNPLSFSFPANLETFRISGLDEPIRGSDGGRLLLPENLKILVISGCNMQLLDCVIFPSSVEEIHMNGCKITSLESYDDDSGLSTVGWSQLVKLKSLTLTENNITSLRHWRPLPNLSELNMWGNNLLPFFPQELCSLKSLTISVKNDFSPTEVHLPPNLEEWVCLLEVDELHVPLSICNHRKLRDWRIENYCSKPFDLRFPPHVRGKLVLCTLKLTNCNTPPDIKKFYDDMERAFGRSVITRDENVSRTHDLV